MKPKEIVGLIVGALLISFLGGLTSTALTGCSKKYVQNQKISSTASVTSTVTSDIKQSTFVDNNTITKVYTIPISINLLEDGNISKTFNLYIQDVTNVSIVFTTNSNYVITNATNYITNDYKEVTNEVTNLNWEWE
jgi:hypothetical protein